MRGGVWLHAFPPASPLKYYVSKTWVESIGDWDGEHIRRGVEEEASVVIVGSSSGCPMESFVISKDGGV
jgi:hypothetical protein